MVAKRVTFREEIALEELGTNWTPLVSTEVEANGSIFDKLYLVLNYGFDSF